MVQGPIAICASFVVTLAAMLIGHTAEPTAWEPKTTRMLLSNVIFDGLTFWITMLLLGWTATKNTMRRIPGVILADLVIAGVLACASLYVGLVATAEALSLPEILNVLIARDVQGNHWEVGPYFWTMHTAFLPTCAYLLLMLVAWLGKLILIPADWFFRQAKGNPNPLKLTALLFAILVVVCAALHFAADTKHEHAKERELVQVSGIFGTYDSPVTGPAAGSVGAWETGQARWSLQPFQEQDGSPEGGMG